MKTKIILSGIGIIVLFNILVFIFSKSEFYIFNLLLVPLTLISGCLVYETWQENVIDEWQKDPEKEKYTYIIKSTELPNEKDWIFFEIIVDLSGFEYLCYNASKICTEKTDIDKLRETVMKEFFEKENKKFRDTKRMNTKVIYKSKLEEERNKI